MVALKLGIHPQTQKLQLYSTSKELILVLSRKGYMYMNIQGKIKGFCSPTQSAVLHSTFTDFTCTCSVIKSEAICKRRMHVTVTYITLLYLKQLYLYFMFFSFNNVH